MAALPVIDPTDLVNRRAFISVSSTDGRQVMAQGSVVAYAKDPTLVIEHLDGTQSSWPVSLPIEELPKPHEAYPKHAATGLLPPALCWAALPGDVVCVRPAGHPAEETP